MPRRMSPPNEDGYDEPGEVPDVSRCTCRENGNQSALTISGSKGMARRGTPIPFALRDEIRNLLLSGKSLRQIAAHLGISRDTAGKYSRLFRSQNQTKIGGN